MASFRTKLKYAVRTISRAYGRPDSFFRVKFCNILRVYLGEKIGYIRSKYVYLNAEITRSNNKQNKTPTQALTPPAEKIGKSLTYV